MGFHRLAIHDITTAGRQPFVEKLENGLSFVYMCNGEIYNYKALIADHGFVMSSGSDCEVIGKLYAQSRDIKEVARQLDGEFAIAGVLLDANSNVLETVVARDQYGVRPLYYIHNGKGWVFSSVLAGVPAPAKHFPPGECWTIVRGTDVRTQVIYDAPRYPSAPTSDILVLYTRVANALIRSVEKRLDSDRPIGFLLSGGLDSSLVVSIATRLIGKDRVRTFSIGMEGSEDLRYAREVATFLGVQHTEVHFTEHEGIFAIPDTVGAIETYDITTIRASVPQFLLAKYIREKTDVRVILNGDGADEVQMGYMYFHNSPSAEDARSETERLLKDIYMFDGLRVDRTLGAHGLEARVPFLDPEFVEASFDVPLHLRRQGMEKQFIRSAFQLLYPDCLPRNVLWRRKEAFSDGVSQQGVSWYTLIQRALQSNAITPVPHIQPHTPESACYRKLFDATFPGQYEILPYYWMPKWSKTTDPSARTLAT